mmetsp:Transcript_13668/g.29485  ORF Transcript_13668/g.29485 Transcript_13668/m.29485 type:complete len:214 (+) Transcript_13668:95-736(+)
MAASADSRAHWRSNSARPSDSLEMTLFCMISDHGACSAASSPQTQRSTMCDESAVSSNRIASNRPASSRVAASLAASARNLASCTSSRSDFPASRTSSKERALVKDEPGDVLLEGELRSDRELASSSNCCSNGIDKSIPDAAPPRFCSLKANRRLRNFACVRAARSHAASTWSSNASTSVVAVAVAAAVALALALAAAAALAAELAAMTAGRL